MPNKTIADLPEHLVARILLAATWHDDLLRHVNVCARVCADWHRVVSGCAAYGAGWGADAAGRAERARALKRIRATLRRTWEHSELENTELLLSECGIGDEGGAALGAALQVWPAARVITSIYLDDNNLTSTGLAPVVAALRRSFATDGLKLLDVGNNPSLGDAALTLLAGALPPTLEELTMNGTGCGDPGMVAIAAKLPALTGLQSFACAYNTDVGQVGWAALGAALPRLPALSELTLHNCSGMGDGGVAALVIGLPEAAALSDLDLEDCGVGDAGAEALAAVLPRCFALEGVNLMFNEYRAATRALLDEAAREVVILHPLSGSLDNPWDILN